ncbi:hypothetical protein Y032_0035g3013 [Ancylostoma ceylanicum]|uniref:Uncharacterized protein n=1 Tax=Ancylostoma ceylanicum TaxID=53326 RepID=A0A016ULZ3_9BILA|nr:hypothetical protein Y032_0035g3013 [Ancylostoma ceylanicum]
MRVWIFVTLLTVLACVTQVSPSTAGGFGGAPATGQQPGAVVQLPPPPPHIPTPGTGQQSVGVVHLPPPPPYRLRPGTRKERRVDGNSCLCLSKWYSVLERDLRSLNEMLCRNQCDNDKKIYTVNLMKSAHSVAHVILRA